MLKNMTLKQKLVLVSLIVGVLPPLIIGYFSAKIAGKALEEAAFQKLEAVQTIKSRQIQNHFDKGFDNLSMLVKTPVIINEYKELSDYHRIMRVGASDLFPVDREEYKRIYEKYIDYLKEYIDTHEYYDLFIICKAHGHVMFTVAKESDLGANLSSGSLRDSGLGRIWKKVVTTNKPAFEDFSPYPPSNNEPAAFIGAPIKDESGETVAVAVLQISIDAINEVMQERSGLGETGETYLVGPDKLMRSDSYLDPTYHSVKGSFAAPDKGKVDTEAVREALAGKKGHGLLKDYRGVPVLSAYSPVKIGDTTWAAIAEIDRDEAFAMVSSFKKTIFVTGVAIALIVTFLGLFVSRALSKPITLIVEYVRQFGQGDLTGELKIEQNDEIGDIANNLTGAVGNLRSIIIELSQTTNTLNGASEELSAVASQMASSAEEMSSQAGAVAAAAEQVSANVGTVASAAEESSSVVSNIAVMTEKMSSTFQNVANLARDAFEKVSSMAELSQNMSNNIQNVAAAIEEMSTSFNEVAKNTNNASRISQKANKSAEDIRVKMEVLEKASQQIGKVVSVIKDIADQTNMLALNATIEAAGAGEAGKGFAVVAGEVKELARQSAEATDEIAGQIENIQSSTNEVVQAINEIREVIGEIANINETIASSVEQQTSTTNEISHKVSMNAKSVRGMAENTQELSDVLKEIADSTDAASKNASEVARNVDEASAGVREIAQSSGEAAKGVQDISKNIQGIDIASSQTASGAAQTNSSAQEVSRIAATLKEVVDQFKI